MDTGGAVIKTRDGNLIQSPWPAVANRAQAEMLTTSRELGLTPVSRARVHVTPKKPLKTMEQKMEEHKRRQDLA